MTEAEEIATLKEQVRSLQAQITILTSLVESRYKSSGYGTPNVTAEFSKIRRLNISAGGGQAGCTPDAYPSGFLR
jgi:hypothetical protein